MNFDVTADESTTIAAIADRASGMVTDYPELDAEMDVTATHANGCPLDLAKLLAADDFNFAHDVFGIRGNIDRRTRKLDGRFLPRCAREQS